MLQILGHLKYQIKSNQVTFVQSVLCFSLYMGRETPLGEIIGASGELWVRSEAKLSHKYTSLFELKVSSWLQDWCVLLYILLSSEYAEAFHIWTLEDRMATSWQQEDKLLCLLYLAEQEWINKSCVCTSLLRIGPGTGNPVHMHNTLNKPVQLAFRARAQSGLVVLTVNVVTNFRLYADVLGVHVHRDPPDHMDPWKLWIGLNIQLVHWLFGVNRVQSEWYKTKICFAVCTDTPLENGGSPYIKRHFKEPSQEFFHGGFIEFVK